MKNELNDDFEKDSPVQGAFVTGYRIKNNKINLSKPFNIKLESIILIEPHEQESENNPGSCIAYTYKDTYYMIYVDDYELVTAINSSIYIPRIHMDKYGI